jgi:hypothetical protein
MRAVAAILSSHAAFAVATAKIESKNSADVKAFLNVIENSFRKLLRQAADPPKTCSGLIYTILLLFAKVFYRVALLNG